MNDQPSEADSSENGDLMMEEGTLVGDIRQIGGSDTRSITPICVQGSSRRLNAESSELNSKESSFLLSGNKSCSYQASSLNLMFG